MSEGHQWANSYPLSKLWIEAEIAKERINARHTTDAVLMQSVIVAVLSPDGKGVKNLQDQLRELTDG